MKTEFYRRLKNLCEENNTSITKVTSELGWSTSLGTNWKNGMIPRGEKIEKLADYFGVSVDFLIGKTDEGQFYNSVFIYNNPEANAEYQKTLTKNLDEQKRLIPVFGRVAAGVPLEAIGDIVDQEQLSPDMDSSYEYAGLVIHGNSMSPRFIEGDTVIVRLQDDVESGDTAIVFVNGTDATCKIVKKVDDGIELHSINTDYGIMPFTQEEIKSLPVKIWGKVVELRRKI